MNINFGRVNGFCGLSIACGVIMSKIVYEVTRCFSSSRFQSYSRLSESQKIEWNNRGFSTFHAIVVAIVSFYLVVISDLFKDGAHPELIIDRKSVVSDAIFGISLGYFIYDLRMILWRFPALGGVEYIVHHGLSLYSFSLALLSGQAHLYILMVLFSEITTPFVNLRWYLDLSGLKSSKLYLWNGIALTLGWLFARIILFFFLFGHMYHNFDQVKTMFTLGFYSLLAVPSTLAVMNIFWFWKILRGLKKALSRKTHAQ
ncbi:unnamed protein product [Spirodela intermedia]|uniref:TLC domain-containing protein n=1 Tax=Spirodela intermedia TaxID=51605 RepID=A0A7I8IAI7_SPIIN|nr:unnamed protein product [Spirodela intermedia]CAA6654548.1 unnamed protein product [Spirodela intermedia]